MDNKFNNVFLIAETLFNSNYLINFFGTKEKALKYFLNFDGEKIFITKIIYKNYCYNQLFYNKDLLV